MLQWTITVDRVEGKWGVPENENGEWFIDVCTERELFLANTFIQQNIINWYIYRRGRP